jgi:branched-chain amino acid transport system ATP-binding protein
MSDNHPMLEVRGLSAAYGRVEVLRGVDLRVDAGEIVTLLGANGAGKSTTLRAIVGLVPVRAGSIRLEGRDIAGRAPETVARLGVALVPEGRRLFPGLTVHANLEVAASSWAGWRDAVEGDVEAVLVLFPQLRPRLAQRAWSLSGGEQQMVALGRALMARPRLLLLDEPSLGLAPRLARDVFAAIAAINRRGTSILLVEQNATAALAIAHRGYVMSEGRVVLEGPARDLLDDRHVREAYLGG